MRTERFGSVATHPLHSNLALLSGQTKACEINLLPSDHIWNVLEMALYPLHTTETKGTISVIHQRVHKSLRYSQITLSCVVVYTFLTKPKWMAFHFLVIAVVATMLSLANWQWHRHHERIAFNATLVERVNAPTESIEDVLIQYPKATDAEWRSVDLTGTYLQGHDLSVVNVSQGGRAGFDPVTPLQLNDGRLILINRGFIPLGQTVKDAPTGVVKIQGRLRASSTKRLGAISDATTGVLTEVQRIDITRLAQQMPAPLVDVYVELQTSVPADDATLSRISEPTFSNGPHLGYVGQWILFSLCATGGWVAIVRREVARLKELRLGV